VVKTGGNIQLKGGCTEYVYLYRVQQGILDDVLAPTLMMHGKCREE